MDGSAFRATRESCHSLSRRGQEGYILRVSSVALLLCAGEPSQVRFSCLRASGDAKKASRSNAENMAERCQQGLTVWRRARVIPLVTVEAIILGEIWLDLEETAVLWGSPQPPKAIHARPSCSQLSNVWAPTLKHASRQNVHVRIFARFAGNPPAQMRGVARATP